MIKCLTRLWQSAQLSKEDRYIKNVEAEIEQAKSDMIRLVYAKATIEASIEANRVRQEKLQQCLPTLRECLQKPTI